MISFFFFCNTYSSNSTTQKSSTSLYVSHVVCSIFIYVVVTPMVDFKIVCISDFCKQYKISKERQKQLSLLNEGVRSISEEEFESLRITFGKDHMEMPMINIASRSYHERSDTIEGGDLQRDKKRYKGVDLDASQRDLQSSWREDTTVINENGSHTTGSGQRQQIFLSSDCLADVKEQPAAGYEIVLSENTPVPHPLGHFTALLSDDVTASSSPPIFFPNSTVPFP